jgi:excinuclease UvrABC nuclease subunit
MFDVRLGSSVAMHARIVAMWWDSRAVPDRHDVDLRNLVRDAPKESGVYAITGRHDANAGETALYIGRAEDLSTRIVQSIHDSLSETHANGQRTLFSDVWNLTVRWARLELNLIESAERLLILSHSPPFNSQGVRRMQARQDEYDMFIMNAGRKGPLLPVVAGAYQSPGWRNLSGPVGP